MRVAIAIGLLVVAVVAYFRISAAMRPGREQDERMTAAFKPDPDNKTVVVVRGWSKPELEQILSDFRGMYELPAEAFRVSDRSDGTATIAFPNDIAPKDLFFLVNYIAYPKNFDLGGKPIGVVGHATITAAFGPPDATFVGRAVTIYLPANDTDYDLVYARLDSGAAYRISFSDLIWQPSSDPRVPEAISGL